MNPDIDILNVYHSDANNQNKVNLPAEFADEPEQVAVAELSQHFDRYPDTYSAAELIAIAYRFLRKADARLNEQIAEKRVPDIEGDKSPDEYSDMLFEAQELTAELAEALHPPYVDEEVDPEV